MRLLVQSQCLVVWFKQEPVLGQIPSRLPNKSFLAQKQAVDSLPLRDQTNRPNSPQMTPSASLCLKGSCRGKVLPSPHALT